MGFKKFKNQAGLVRSLDIQHVMQKFDLKRAVKRVLQLLGMYESVHGEDVTRSYFPCIYFFPRHAGGVILNIFGTKHRGDMLCYVNGVEVSLRNVARSWYYASTDAFFAYENVISFDKRLGVKDVCLYPFVGEDELDCRNVLTRKWQYEDIRGKVYDQGECDFSIAEGPNLDPVLSCVLAARIDDPNSFFYGLYYPAFDVDNRTYRLQSWTWTNGIIVKTLLAKSYSEDNAFLREKAIELARKLLDFQCDTGVASGSFMARWDVFDQSPTGVIPVYATNDSAFLGTNGLLAAYKVTGEAVFLDSATRLGNWIVDSAMTDAGQLFIGYRSDIGAWVDNYLFVDGGFTASFFAELYRVTNDEKWFSAMILFTDWYIKVLYDPHSKRFWRIWYSDRPTAKELFSRGQAWALDGIISAYELTQSDNYSAVIRGVADTLVKYQHEDGFWSYILNKPSSGDCSKATPILAYHLLRAYQIFRDETWLRCARRAVEGGRRSVDMDGSDRRSFGGIHRASLEGCIFGPTNVDSVFMYSQCYQLLAEQLLAEVVSG